MMYEIPAECHKIAQLLLSPEIRDVVLVPHVRVDGDCLGSMLGMSLALESLGKNTTMYLTEQPPSNLNFLQPLGLNRTVSTLPQRKFDALIAIELSNDERAQEDPQTGKGLNIYGKSQYIINIDHHHGNAFAEGHKWVDAGSSSCSELIYMLIKAMGIEFTKPIATALYTGLITDTGGFSYNSITTRAHLIAAELIPLAELTGNIFSYIFSKSPEELELEELSRATMRTVHQGKTSYAWLTREMLDKTGLSENDSNSILPSLNKVRGGQVFLMFKDFDKDKIRISLRSRGLPLNEIPRDMELEGGGHSMATGMSATNEQLLQRTGLSDRCRAAEALLLPEIEKRLRAAGYLN